MPDENIVWQILEEHEQKLFSVLLGFLRSGQVTYDQVCESLADYYGTDFAGVFEEYMREIQEEV